MWQRTIEVNGLEFSMLGSSDCELMLSKEQIEKAGDRLPEITDWFLKNGDEFALAELWREIHYEAGHFDDDTLERIYANRFLTSDERRAVFVRPTRREPAKRTAKPRKGYVYLVEGQNGAYKIGKSVDAKARIESLGVVLPFPITPVCVIETEDMNGLEKRLHEEFEDLRINGEWFCLSPDDVDYIKSL